MNLRLTCASLLLFITKNQLAYNIMYLFFFTCTYYCEHKVNYYSKLYGIFHYIIQTKH